MTTKTQDFKPFSFPKNHNPNAEVEKNKPSTTVHDTNAKFAKTSTYGRDFRDWNHARPYIVPAMHLKHYDTGIPMQSKTNYREAFKDPKELKRKEAEWIREQVAGNDPSLEQAEKGGIIRGGH